VFTLADGKQIPALSPHDPSGEEECINAHFKLSEPASCTATYEYDMGDGWMHSVVLEKHEWAKTDAPYPRVTDGKRACPPEDCGGVGGYHLLLEALADPTHEEHRDMVEWMGQCGYPTPFDPAHFDKKEVVFEDGQWEVGGSQSGLRLR